MADRKSKRNQELCKSCELPLSAEERAAGNAFCTYCRNFECLCCAEILNEILRCEDREDEPIAQP
jgi:hypothetical protein